MRHTHPYCEAPSILVTVLRRRDISLFLPPTKDRPGYFYLPPHMFSTLPTVFLCVLALPRVHLS